MQECTHTLPHDHAIKCTQIYKHTHTQSLPCNHAHSCSHTHFYPHTQSLLCTHAHSHALSHTITLTVTPSRNHTLTLTVKLVHTHSPTHTYSQAWSPNSDPHCTSIYGLARTDLTASQPTPGHRCHSWQPFKPLSSLASEQRSKGAALDLILDLSMSEDRMPPCLKPPNPALGRVRTHNFIKQEMQEGSKPAKFQGSLGTTL
jgi:hypothetical protein